jgi:hypothetical protein
MQALEDKGKILYRKIGRPALALFIQDLNSKSGDQLDTVLHRYEDPDGRDSPRVESLLGFLEERLA